MAGITAGVKDSGLKYGDIVVAEESWDAWKGKIVTDDKGQQEFKPSPHHIPLDAGLKEKLEAFLGGQKEMIAGIPTRWRGNRSDHPLSVGIGPVVSGASVVENAEIVTKVVGQNRKVLGIDMETYGLYCAARIVPQPQPKVLSAKSVSDFGIPPKTDEFQRYAAFTSAQFIYEFAIEHL